MKLSDLWVLMKSVLMIWTSRRRHIIFLFAIRIFILEVEVHLGVRSLFPFRHRGFFLRRWAFDRWFIWFKENFLGCYYWLVDGDVSDGFLDLHNLNWWGVYLPKLDRWRNGIHRWCVLNIGNRVSRRKFLQNFIWLVLWRFRLKRSCSRNEVHLRRLNIRTWIVTFWFCRGNFWCLLNYLVNR